MKNKELKMDLPSVDDLFENVSGKDIFTIERVIPISINKLQEFPNHPFKVRDDEEMQELVERIESVGVITPLIVRPTPDGNYQIISGHRRKEAGIRNGLKELPCIVRNYNDDEAVIIMVSSNHQREKILPSEKAFAYKMLLEAEKRQGKRNDLTSSQIATKLQGTANKIGEKFGDSRDKVYRYVRLTELTKDLLDLVDTDIMAFTPAVEISYLSKDDQNILYHIYKKDLKTPSVSQAQELKRLSQADELTATKIIDIMAREKPNQIEKYKFNRDRIERLLPNNIYSDKQAEDYVVMCIEEHNERERKAKVKTRSMAR